MGDLLLVYLGPPSSGGTVRALARLARLWSQSALEVEIACYDGRGALDELGLPMIRVGRPLGSQSSEVSLRSALREVPRLIRYLLRIRRAVRDRPGAVVLPFLTGTALVTLAATVGLPNRVIVCERNDTSMQPFGWHVRLLQRLLYPRAAAITINTSNPAASDLLRRISRGRPIHVVPNPHPGDMRPADPANSRIVLSVGRLVEQKRHATLVDAFATIAERIPEWHAVIVGEGPLRRDLEAQIERLGLAERITLTGQVDDPRPHYASAGLFVLPSDYEGTSNALLEAASAGLPCIVSEAATPPRTEGIFVAVPTASSHALAMRMLEVCTDDGMRTSLALGAKRWLDQSMSDAVLADWISVIRTSSAKKSVRRSGGRK